MVITDEDLNEDVWSSRFLIDAGMDLKPGQEYTISFDLTGDHGVGEFFLCKGENIDLRYDETFTAEEGSRSITFTPVQNRIFIGMQMGNLGYGNSVTATINSLCLRSESENPALLRTENCSATANDGEITATDTSDNNDVWNSKLLFDPNVTLEIGKTYRIELELLGDNGVGEFFLCKSQDLNDRYDSTFLNTEGSHRVVFTAESENVYIGMQIGNVGKGNSVSARIGNIKVNVPTPKEPTVSYTVDGNTITVTDLGKSNDVWTSAVLYDAGIELEPGKKYEISFKLSGDNGVGEFFLCKSENLNDRYDETFSNAAGEKTVVFTAEGTKAYVGMQVGNLGKGNSVTLTINEVKEYDESAQTDPKVLIAENCEYEVNSSGAKTEIAVTDTSENNDVWNSKLLYYLGEILEKNRFFAAFFNLSGENGVGEFFFCKSDNIDDRYDETWTNTAGERTVIFQAADSKLYAGMQFGNVGEGNEVTADINDVYLIPGKETLREGCTDALGHNSVTLTDTGDNDDVWNSKAVYDTGIILEPGKTYTATFTLSGDNGVGEFFFLKDNNIDNRYSFDNQAGTHTITFTAENTELFFGIQCGNIGSGNSVTVSDITVTPNEPTMSTSSLAGPAALTAFSEESAAEAENEPAENAASGEESAAVTAEETSSAPETVEPVEEPVAPAPEANAEVTEAE